ncbi:MAG: 23S rRNA (adenine(2503)-C(2))-methyltransferase RlmN [Nitrospirae bacterium]|nr:23S rRNA (adenine(2503)-C(2))-methyltransferase RlmN [Nitrospirota bacterium]
MKKNFKEISKDNIALCLESLGQKPYRAEQILNWIYKKLAASFDEMTDLPLQLRKSLNETACISNLALLSRQVSEDGTQKFLFGLEDGNTIESVLIPDKDRLTLCISSQAGCRMGCRFCMTGRLGLKRNLKAYEIVDQVITVSRLIEHSHPSPLPSRERDLSAKITNIVFMGMGEPLDNIDEVALALWRLTGLMGFSKRKITVSTAGIVPKIYELAQKGPEINLAISLNATTDEIRSKIMPINKKYPLKELLTACKKYPLSPRRRITFEYVLLKGINDSKEDAIRLVRLLRGIRSKINLIPYNPSDPEKNFKQPLESDVLSFQNILTDSGMTAIIRKSKGEDIMAACGQLRAAYTNELIRKPS